MATVRQKHAALKHAASQAASELHAALQAESADDGLVAWWSRVANAEQAYAAALIAAASAYYDKDMFAFDALCRLSTRVERDAKTSRAKAQELAAVRPQHGEGGAG